MEPMNSDRVETQHFDGPTALAVAFGKPVYLPDQWPPPFAVSPSRYLLDRGPAGIGYRIDVGTDDDVPVLIAGRLASPSQQEGTLGALPNSYWFAVPELSENGGLALRQPNGHFHLVLGMPAQLHISGYRNLAQAIAAAQSLVRFDPYLL